MFRNQNRRVLHISIISVAVSAVKLIASDRVLTSTPPHPPNKKVGRDSSVGIGTGYRLDSPGIESRWRARFSVLFQTGPGADPASYIVGSVSFQGVNRRGCGVNHPPSSSAKFNP